jgi:hypothetical protein
MAARFQSVFAQESRARALHFHVIEITEKIADAAGLPYSRFWHAIDASSIFARWRG